MAKIKFSALVSDMRNKLNGSVLSKNRYGSYMRNKVTPVNPQTSFQQNARAVLSALSSGFGSLTEAQRKGWRDLAQNLPFTDIFGDPKILDAKSLYVKLNANLQKIGETIISAAPVKVGVPAVALESGLVSVSGGNVSGLTLQIEPDAIPAGFALVVYATPGLPAQRNFVKNQFRYIGTFPAVAGEIEFPDEYQARLGTPIVGSKVTFRAALVSTNSGQQGIPSELALIVS